MAKQKTGADMFESVGRVCLRMAIREVTRETERIAQHEASVLLFIYSERFALIEDIFARTEKGGRNKGLFCIFFVAE